MTQKASAPRYDLANDRGVSRNEGNRAGLLNEAAGGVQSVSVPDAEFKFPAGTF